MILATASPEQPLPHTGAFVGDRLGLRCGSFDLAAACAGFVYELVVGASMLTTGCRNVLIVGAETVSRLMDPTDRATSILFGDGAGAAVIVPAEGDEGLLAWDLGCDGSAAHLLEITAGGSRLPASIETVQARKHYMTMAGQEVFRRAVRAVVDSATATLDRAEITAAEVDWFVPHQANIRIIEAAAKRLGVPMERTVVNIERYGNTSSASIPLALFEAVDDGRVKAGDLVLLSGFGAGHDVGERAPSLGRSMTAGAASHDTSPALVTGGSKGIGASICVALARQGPPGDVLLRQRRSRRGEPSRRSRPREARRSPCAPTWATPPASTGSSARPRPRSGRRSCS